MSWTQWIGDLLASPCDVIVEGTPSRWTLWRLLRHYGVSVHGIRTERDPRAPWWNRWDKQTDVIVGRYQDIIVADILRAHGYDVRYPHEGAQYERVPRRFAMRLHAIAMQRQRLQQPPTVQPQPRRAPWQQPARMRR